VYELPSVALSVEYSSDCILFGNFKSTSNSYQVSLKLFTGQYSTFSLNQKYSDHNGNARQTICKRTHRFFKSICSNFNKMKRAPQRAPKCLLQSSKVFLPSVQKPETRSARVPGIQGLLGNLANTSEPPIATPVVAVAVAVHAALAVPPVEREKA